MKKSNAYMVVILRTALILWTLLMGAVTVYVVHLDSSPLPMELQNTSRDPEEVCINGQCEAEQE